MSSTILEFHRPSPRGSIPSSISEAQSLIGDGKTTEQIAKEKGARKGWLRSTTTSPRAVAA